MFKVLFKQSLPQTTLLQIAIVDLCLDKSTVMRNHHLELTTLVIILKKKFKEIRRDKKFIASLQKANLHVL